MNDVGFPSVLTGHVLFEMLESAPDGVLITGTDGRILFANEELARIFGYARNDLVGRPVEDLLPEDLRERHLAQRRQQASHFRSHDMGRGLDITGRHHGGGRIDLSVRLGSTLTPAGRLTVAYVNDITADRRREAELRQLNRALRLVHVCNETLVRAADEPTLLRQLCMHLIDPGGYPSAWVVLEDTPGEAARVAEAAIADAAATGTVEPSTIVALAARAIQVARPLIDPGSPSPAGAVATIALPFQTGDLAAGALLIASADPGAFSKDEQELLVELADDLGYGIGTLRGRTERQRQAALLQRHRDLDDLTGLPNRRHLSDHVDALIAAHPDGPIALLVLGIDRFTQINDAFGHAIGDQVLAGLAGRLQDALRGSDLLGRLAGDEFALLLGEPTDGEHAARVADKLRTVLRQPIECAGREILLTASVGAGIAPRDGASANELLAHAEAAMFAAKGSGRDAYGEYDRRADHVARRRIDLEQGLRKAVDRQQLELHYQPVVDLASGRIVGAEALLRWTHPELGAIPPAEFIPVAEESGQILPIGRWVIAQACRQGAAWRSAGHDPIRIAVNLSARQFRDRELLKVFTDALADTGLAADVFVVEITESVLMDDVDATRRILAGIKALGIRTSLDDFGTGYSSLAYLKRLPIDSVKIDRSFVSEITVDPNDAAIVLAVISMARAMNLKVIAEGVESEAQLAFLRQRGCDEVQGYHISPPVDAGTFSALLVEGRRFEADPEGRPGLLIVDDEPNVTAAIRRSLRQEGYPVHIAQSGAEALDILARNRIAVVVSDQRMPEMNGTELLSRIHALHPKVVRIMLSGYTDLESVTRAVNEGAIYQFLTKPWDDNVLRRTIRNAFARFEATSQT